MESVTPGWRLVFIGVEGQPVSLLGFDPWTYEWKLCHENPIVVAHPSYPSQRHRMFVYDLDVSGERVRLAAGEFSNGVWGLYVPT
jgi:hypothetical protein